MNRNKTDSGIGIAVVRLFFLLLVMVVFGCRKSDLPPEQVAVDVMTKCVTGALDGLDDRVAGEVKNFVSRDRELRKKGMGWFPSIKSASFSVLEVKADDNSAFVRLKAVLDGKSEAFPVRLEKSIDGRWKVISFNDDKEKEITK